MTPPFIIVFGIPHTTYILIIISPGHFPGGLFEVLDRVGSNERARQECRSYGANGATNYYYLFIFFFNLHNYLYTINRSDFLALFPGSYKKIGLYVLIVVIY